MTKYQINKNIAILLDDDKLPIVESSLWNKSCRWKLCKADSKIYGLCDINGKKKKIFLGELIHRYHAPYKKVYFNSRDYLDYRLSNLTVRPSLRTAMTNFERWMEYNDVLPSPTNYIEWGYRYLIGAALQRRVWLGDGEQKCFPNKYCLLVGPPGTGKGLVIKEIYGVLSHWKLDDVVKLSNPEKDGATGVHEAVLAADKKSAEDSMNQANNSRITALKPLLIPIAPDATTYEALVEHVASSYRRINYIKVNGDNKPEMKVYGHSSACFCLPEFSSLLRKRTEDTVNYMLGLYDCPETYEYSTKTQGKDMVRRGCLNLIAGTTPSFMERIFDTNLLDEGFSSRLFAICASRNRFSCFFIKGRSPAQEEHRKVILEHVRKLTSLYGPIRISQQTRDYMESWMVKHDESRSNRANKSAKLDAYYARENLHVTKVAISEWFSDHTELEIPLEYFQRAIEILQKEEKTMDNALVMNSANPIAKLARQIKEYIKSKEKVSSVELIADMFYHGSNEAIGEALNHLIEIGDVFPSETTDSGTDRKTIWYQVKL